MTITVRWAESPDRKYSFVAESVPDSVVEMRIAERRVLIAELEGKPCGALQLEYLWGTRPYIALIRVEQRSQRRGVGRAMLDFIGTKLHEDGHTHLYSSSQVDEAQPQAWHRRMGFIECGIIAGLNPGGVGEVFFVKPLAR